MMKRRITASAGTTERADCHITVQEAERPSLTISSKVQVTYGAALRREVMTALTALGAQDLAVSVDDQGALPYTVAARVEAAVRRLRPTTMASLAVAQVAPNQAHRRTGLLRTRLYLPGNTPKFIINAGLHKPDAIILDLEDAVAPSEKEAARILVHHALAAVDFGKALRTVRVNSLPLGLEDVRLLAAAGVDAFILPKIEQMDEVVTVAAMLDGLGVPETRLIPIIESARGVLNAPLIAAAPRVLALAIGLEDYTADIGAQRSAAGRESEWACSMIVNAARAAGVLPLASVYANVDDAVGLQAYTQHMKSLGFEGIGCIHPRQIGLVHQAFAPTAQDVAHAEQVVAAYEAALAAGQGVFALNGKMIDAPVVARARKVLAWQTSS